MYICNIYRKKTFILLSIHLVFLPVPKFWVLHTYFLVSKMCENCHTSTRKFKVLVQAVRPHEQDLTLTPAWATAKLQRNKAKHSLSTLDWGKGWWMNWRAGTMVAAGALALPYTESWVLSPALQTGTGTRENVLQALVRGIWGLGLWQIWCPEVQLLAWLKWKLFEGYCGESLSVAVQYAFNKIWASLSTNQLKRWQERSPPWSRAVFLTGRDASLCHNPLCFPDPSGLILFLARTM